jgi:hypothetical protein
MSCSETPVSGLGGFTFTGLQAGLILDGRKLEVGVQSKSPAFPNSKRDLPIRLPSPNWSKLIRNQFAEG